ncbi:hypothetical protein BO86DRAFT_403928 [Aspergillus japonicus CBS 114.51]|uniref:Uncharacterized protein n=1 Tax=Aspergillus japonicus CBS 114.51 TaxID=1448312 RepID=A0A8T8WN48_ASPJA|nr:hypothetical protein BO86DRAFT_403928 [Aspergillus japonicus CBS 114.51]RAH77216.1 hypothetical protein BO86DRAFT_403928 [Aspergillus japonicus CBS 114.51]
MAVRRRYLNFSFLSETAVDRREVAGVEKAASVPTSISIPSIVVDLSHYPFFVHSVLGFQALSYQFLLVFQDSEPRNGGRRLREFVVMIDTWENVLALRDAFESKSNYSSVDGQLQARFFGDPIPIVMVPIDQLDPRPSVSNMTRMPQINPREPYSDAGLTRDEMEGLAREYRIEGRGDAVEGDYVLIGSGVATVLLWACVSWLWNTVFA